MNIERRTPTSPLYCISESTDRQSRQSEEDWALTTGYSSNLRRLYRTPPWPRVSLEQLLRDVHLSEYWDKVVQQSAHVS